MDDVEDSYELDASVIFEQEADNLTSVQNLEDALSRFGFTKDDKISRRELVNIYNRIRDAMEPEIFRLANSSQYANAKEMRARLTNLRNEFDHLQLSGAARIRQEQQLLFEKAAHALSEKLQHQQDLSVSNVEKIKEQETATHTLFQTIERTNLHQTLSKIHRPSMRYTKRLIELYKAEYNLNKLKQYDEAIKVRRMIDKLMPLEEKKFYDNFEKSIANKQKKLDIDQQFNQMRFDEKLKALEWKEIRRRELESKV